MLTATLIGIALTGNYPGVDAVGLEEDHPAVVRMIDAHAEHGVCTDAVGTTVTDEAHGIYNMPAEFIVDGNCEPLPGNDWLEVF